MKQRTGSYSDALRAIDPELGRRAAPARISSRVALVLAVLAVVFGIELPVMFLLHAVLPDLGWAFESIAVSFILTPLIAPPLWWLVARRDRAEEAVQRSEQQFRSLIENASDIVTVLDNDGTIVFISPSVRRVLGYEPEDLVGKNAFDIIHPEDVAATLGSFSQLLQNPGGHEAAEFRFRHADGSWRVLEAVGKHAVHEQARTTLIINARDITERRLAEDALRESEERFRQLVNQATDAIIITDFEGRLVDVNRSACDSLGYTREELLTLSLPDIAADFTPERLSDTGRRLLDGDPVSIDDVHRRKDGTTFPVEVRVGLVELDGRPLTLGLARDVTERRQAEEALRESEERFRKIFEEGPLGMAIVGVDRRFVKVNAALCNLVGYTEPELLSLTFPEITHPDHVDADIRAVGQLLRGEIPFYRVDKRYIRKDGQPVWIALTASIIRDREGQTAYFLAMIQDISERKRMEEVLRASEERARRVVETAYDAFISVDADGVITAWNAAAETVFGWPGEQVIGRPLAETIIPPQHRDAHTSGLRRFLATGEGRVLNKRIEITALHRDGHELPVEMAVWTVRTGEALSFHAFIHDVTLRKKAEVALRQLNTELESERNTVRDLNRLLEFKVRERTRDLRRANVELRDRNRQLVAARSQAATDGLTGLGNHRSFQEQVRHSMTALDEAESISLVMLDIDGFKCINDSLGHQAGDDILRMCAQAFANVVGDESVYRYGGDEFAILLPGCDMPAAEKVAEQLRRATTDALNGASTRVTISLGVASHPETASTADELIYQADAAMYAAKMAGKNRTCRWDRLPTAGRTSERRSAPVR